MGLLWVKKRIKQKISFYWVKVVLVSIPPPPLFFTRPWEAKEETRREEGHCLLLDFWSVFIGLGSVVLRVQASPCFSSFVLSKVCPMHWGFVWWGRRHITFCLLSQAGGWGRLKGRLEVRGGGGAVQQNVEGGDDKKQTYSRPRLFKAGMHKAF